ncbi:MAG: glycerophosphodiester phosphodiesterase family protein [bacterium]
MEIIAHRGASSLAPENTLLSIQKAIDLHAHIIEIDCQLTRDQRVIVFHDVTIDNFAHAGAVRVSDLTYAQLQIIDLGKEQKIPLLEDVLALVGKKSKLMIETKTTGTSLKVLDTAYDCKMMDSIALTSSLIPEILIARKYLPGLPVSLVIKYYPINFDDVVRLYNIREFSIDRTFITGQIVQTLKNKGYLLRVFTVNDISDAAVYETWGVDGIFTDYPQRFILPELIPVKAGSKRA